MKHGKKYVEAAKLYDKQTQYDRDEAVAKLISEQDVTDVMQISRSVALLYFRTELVNRFVYLYSLRMQKQKRLRQQALTLLAAMS